jgi:hypothetical protein
VATVVIIRVVPVSRGNNEGVFAGMIFEIVTNSPGHGAAAGDEGDRDAEDDELPPSPRYWSLQHGGCEGINHSSAGIVEKEEIEEKRRRARKHWRSFPDKEIRMTSWYL